MVKVDNMAACMEIIDHIRNTTGYINDNNNESNNDNDNSDDSNSDNNNSNSNNSINIDSSNSNDGNGISINSSNSNLTDENIILTSENSSIITEEISPNMAVDSPTKIEMKNTSFLQDLSMQVILRKVVITLAKRYLFVYLYLYAYIMCFSMYVLHYMHIIIFIFTCM